MLIPIQCAYLCPMGHISDSATECGCGSRNLYPLARILDRDTTDREDEYVGLMCELPAFREWEN
jgi:hypothetical protein